MLRSYQSVGPLDLDKDCPSYTKNKSDVRPWLEQQDAYTLHISFVKRFLGNPYTVKNVMDV